MFRRLFVSVLVAALALVIAPSPSSGLDAAEVRPRADDHFQCMYRCDERGESFRPPPRRRPPAQPRQPAGDRPRKAGAFTALRHIPSPDLPDHFTCRPRPWPWYGHGGWGQGGWDDRSWPGIGGDWCPRPIWRPRPWPCGCRPWWHRPRWHHRYDHYDRYRDRDRDRSGDYNHHRSHPRGRDF